MDIHAIFHFKRGFIVILFKDSKPHKSMMFAVGLYTPINWTLNDSDAV